MTCHFLIISVPAVTQADHLSGRPGQLNVLVVWELLSICVFGYCMCTERKEPCVLWGIVIIQICTMKGSVWPSLIAAFIDGLAAKVKGSFLL